MSKKSAPDLHWLDWVIDERPRRHGWAPGQYLFVCRKCKHNDGKDRNCIGDKRAIQCADCAYALPETMPSVPQPSYNALECARNLRLIGKILDTPGDVDRCAADTRVWLERSAEILETIFKSLQK